jgi:hypothetical protein
MPKKLIIGRTKITLLGKCLDVILLAVTHGDSGAPLLYSSGAPDSGALLLAPILDAH